MSKPTLAYILGTNLDHPGIVHKVNGQLNALNAHFSTTLIHYPYTSSSNIVIKLIQLAIFHYRALIAIITQDQLYVRYNAKLIILNIILAIASLKKPIFLEYGSKFNDELRIVKRPIERAIHQLTLRIFSKAHLNHATVTEDIQQELTQFGISKKQCLTMPNGFQMPKINKALIDATQVSIVKALKKQHDYVAVFVGNNYPWHGIDRLISLATETKNTHIILIGPKEKLVTYQFPANITLLGTANPDTLYDLLSYCDVGIGSLNLQLLNMHQGSPLKTPMYLCFGLPIIVSNDDMCGLIPTLSNYVINIHNTGTPFQKAIEQTQYRDQIARIAQTELDWDNTMTPMITYNKRTRT